MAANCQAPMTSRRFPMTILAAFAAFFVPLSVIAWLSPEPDRVTDRDIYERAAAHVIVDDCSDLHCFRVLVPWVLGRFPGASAVRWKTYAACSNAAAAAGVWMLCLSFGLSRRTAAMASTMSAFGFGSLYTLHDPFTSDPLMYAIGPFMTHFLLAGLSTAALILGVVGVLAKEFAAAPLYAFALYQAVERKWTPALRALIAGNAAFLVWAVFTIVLMVRFNYGWGLNGAESANLAGGATLALWAGRQTPRGMASAMFIEFGVLYALAPVGFVLASARMRRLAIVSLPIAAVFAYVQQPDRALWNFHYLVAPFAALVLERAPATMAWTTIALFAIGNLRVGAQIPIAPWSQVAILGSLALGCIVSATALRAAGIGRRRSIGTVNAAIE
jgi:hypothetical protein